ncbi:Asp23/Gls24 family envelope stress response protein [Pseudonocardia nigra]|uniref:Asp23/Gls24 family envelope stress response protein n=1 Tax=Pseudonocardia nigra TaxID=1921578 RepID=UPI001C604665|nr:Asp23/Gls24 family envelope stress response protein [Pseudonocardia nigra]
MAMNPNSARTDGARTRRHALPCGRSVEQVWQELEAGQVSAHGADCPHCSTARASLEQLAEATRQLVADPLEPPPRLLDRIMGAVRAELTTADPIPLPSESGQVDISTHALAAVLRYVVDSVDGLRAHRCRIELAPDVAHTVRAWMSVSLHYPTDGIAAVEEARRRARAALSERIGLRLESLDVELTDVWLNGPSEPEPS